MEEPVSYALSILWSILYLTGYLTRAREIPASDGALALTIPNDYKEDFYHAFLAGILASFHYSVESNREHGEGRSDIVVYDEENSCVVIFEAKVAKSPEELPAACDAALRQIEARQYAEDFRDEYDEILCYGIAFYKKRCLVKRATN